MFGAVEFIARFRYIGEIAIEHVSVNNEMVRIADVQRIELAI